MIFTIDFIRDTFERFNRLLFQSSLPAPRFALSRSRQNFGMLRLKSIRTITGKTKKSDYTLACSVMYELTREEAEDVVIHEMIHYYIELNGLHDTSTHGQLFRAMMDMINAVYHRHITITAPDKPLTAEAKAPSGRLHFVFLADIEGMGMGYAAVASTRVLYMARRLHLIPRIRSWRLFASYSPALDNVPHVRSFKFYDAPPELLREIENKGEELGLQGDRIVVLKR